MSLKVLSKWLALGCICWSVPAVAQEQEWLQVDSLFAPLPPGFHVYRSSTPIEGKPNVSYYAVAELRNRQLQFDAQTGRGQRYTPAQYYQQEGLPLLVVNCTFFSFQNNQNLNLVVRRGMMQAFNTPAVKPKGDSLYRYITRSAIGIDRHRKADVAWCFTDSSERYPFALVNGPSMAKGQTAVPEWPDIRRQLKGGGLRKKVRWKMETAVGGGPVLLQGGRVGITNIEEYMFVNGLNDRHPRTAMGYTQDGKLIVLVVEGRNPGVAEGASLQHLAKMMQALGCHEALNLDGGGSSSMLINGHPTIKPSDKEGERAVPAVFLVRTQQ